MKSLMIGSLESYQRRPISGYSNSNWPAPEGESRSEDGNGNQNAGFFDSIDPKRNFALFFSLGRDFSIRGLHCLMSATQR
jgi:hypothetical protein